MALVFIVWISDFQFLLHVVWFILLRLGSGSSLSGSKASRCLHLPLEKVQICCVTTQHVIVDLHGRASIGLNISKRYGSSRFHWRLIGMWVATSTPVTLNCLQPLWTTLILVNRIFINVLNVQLFCQLILFSVKLETKLICKPH